MQRLCRRGRVQMVSTHSRPKAAGLSDIAKGAMVEVSTHSRPKAAGAVAHRMHNVLRRFNSQPPEGGWNHLDIIKPYQIGFNSQPPEGGWETDVIVYNFLEEFQLTAARRRLG